MKGVRNDHLIIFLWGFCVCVYALTHFYMLPKNWGIHAISDVGIFSILTITILTIAFIRLLYSALAIKKHQKILYILAYIVLIYGLREADFHRLFTEEHLTNI